VRALKLASRAFSNVQEKRKAMRATVYFFSGGKSLLTIVEEDENTKPASRAYFKDTDKFR